MGLYFLAGEKVDGFFQLVLGAAHDDEISGFKSNGGVRIIQGILLAYDPQYQGACLLSQLGFLNCKAAKRRMGIDLMCFGVHVQVGAQAQSGDGGIEVPEYPVSFIADALDLEPARGHRADR